MRKTVVMVTYSGDMTGMLTELRAHIQARGARALRFDTDRFPLDSQVQFGQESDGETILIRDSDGQVRLTADDAIWYRRARWAATLPHAMDKQLRSACVMESEALLRGVMAAAPCFVLDPPERVQRNGHKPQQQRLARQVGLATPRTLMTNDPQAARDFIASCPRGAVAKMLSAFAIYGEQNEEQVVFTTALSPAHIRQLDGLRYAPMVFQERIEKRLELRVTVIGNHIFAAAVDSARIAGAEVDWRQRGVTLLQSWKPYKLPADTERQIGEYMCRLGVQYSAIDILVEPSGRHVFLEANPVGECFWLQGCEPHFPLSQALADVLLDEPGARRSVDRSAPAADAALAPAVGSCTEAA